MIALISAYDNKRAIGKNGSIPWTLPEDMKRFKQLTIGNVLIMGRKTFEEIGSPLPGRFTIVVSKKLKLNSENCISVNSLAEAVVAAKGRDAFICGGEELFKEGIALADVLYVTEINGDYKGDRFFPKIDHEIFSLISEEKFDNEIGFCFKKYERKPLSYDYILSYKDALASEKGIVPGLSTIKSFMAMLGNPQNDYPIIHIAGTNGKGSTGAMISSILTEAGLKTAHYSSPAVFDPMEIFRINYKAVSKETYCQFMTPIVLLHDFLSRCGFDVPTVFELETAFAFYYFSQMKCDIAVIECGMGGANDATNISDSVILSVLVSIGIDHSKFLGDTLEDITKEKCGIIHSYGHTLAQGQNEKSVLDLIKSEADKKESDLILTDINSISEYNESANGIGFRYKSKLYHLDLNGYYQLYNAICAIDAAEILKKDGYKISDNDIKNGLEKVSWDGRFEIICRKPTIILDGAHNPNAAKMLKASLVKLAENKKTDKIYMVIGVLADKDFNSFASLLSPIASKIFTITPNNSRALDAEKLCNCIKQYNSNTEPAELGIAIKKSLACANDEDIIIACGSLSFLKDAGAIFKKEIKIYEKSE